MADQEPASKPKRRVKNPETFRERAAKAAENDGKPQRTSKVLGAGRAAIPTVPKPLKKAAQSKPVKPLAKVFHRLGRVLVPTYVRKSWQELKQVTWPTWKQSRQLTTAVLVFAIVFGAAIALVDWGLDKLFRNILLK